MIIRTNFTLGNKKNVLKKERKKKKKTRTLILLTQVNCKTKYIDEGHEYPIDKRERDKKKTKNTS